MASLCGRVAVLELAIEEIRTLSRTLVVQDLKKGGLVARINDLAGDLRFDNLFEAGFTHSKTCDIAYRYAMDPAVQLICPQYDN